MTKKDYLLALLNKISDEILPVRLDIVNLLESNVLNETFIDDLISIFIDAKNNTEKVLSQDEIQKSIEFLDKLKAIELKDRQNDAQDILELDRLLDSI